LGCRQNTTSLEANLAALICIMWTIPVPEAIMRRLSVATPLVLAANCILIDGWDGPRPGYQINRVAPSPGATAPAALGAAPAVAVPACPPADGGSTPTQDERPDDEMAE